MSWSGTKGPKIRRGGTSIRADPTRQTTYGNQKGKGERKAKGGKAGKAESSFIIMRPSTRRVTTNKSIVVDSRYVGGSACCFCQAVGHRLGLLPRVGVGNRNEAARERIRHPWSLSLCSATCAEGNHEPLLQLRPFPTGAGGDPVPFQYQRAHGGTGSSRPGEQRRIAGTDRSQ